ncbi:hypothetical protein NLI96_g5233 [Meripilus lineatus]|uniref:CAF17 C-terminal domain-containing protein n=1 Tax=Meripilus lineatus TaxID=2056292 RepID=A0AAD5YJC1_9APHY|nr:hypothetical protein NLI96_g5233 [Physisporinus lineatus]
MVLQTLRRQPFVLDYAIRMEQTFFESGQKGFTGHRHVELERDSRSSRMVGGETEDLSHGENLAMLPPAVRSLLRRTPTVAPIPHRSLIAVTGSQASQFLNGIVSCPVSGPPNRHHFTAFLHAQGRVIYDIFLHAYTTEAGRPGYLIEYDSRPSQETPLLPLLKRYILRAKVRVADVSDQYDVWASWGSEKELHWETERQWSGAPSGVFETVWDPAGEWPWGHEPGVIRDRRAVGLGHRLLVRKGDIPSQTSTHDMGTPEDYLIHRILHGVPEGSIDIPSTLAFPMDSNLDIMGGLDFRKGCYVGQELTVRTYHKGVIRKRIFPVALSSSTENAIPPLEAGQDIKVVLSERGQGDAPRPRPRGTGKLLSSVKGVGLALLRLEHVNMVLKGSATFQLDVSSGSEQHQANVLPWIPSWWPISFEETDSG